MKPTLLILLSTLLLSACMSMGNSKVRDTNKLSSVQKGVTTHQQVRQLFGEPQSVTRKSDGTIQWQYHHMDFDMSASNFIPILGPFIGTTSSDMEMLMINFDSYGTVRDYQTTNSQTRTDGLNIR